LFNKFIRLRFLISNSDAKFDDGILL